MKTAQDAARIAMWVIVAILALILLGFILRVVFWLIVAVAIIAGGTFLGFYLWWKFTGQKKADNIFKDFTGDSSRSQAKRKSRTTRSNSTSKSSSSRRENNAIEAEVVKRKAKK